MDIADPTAGQNKTELHSLAPRVDEFEGKTVGLYDNGKMAAEPVLEVLREKLEKRYTDITISTLAMDTKNDVQDPDRLAEVTEWADEQLDVCIGAIGDCGSCTKFLTWGMQAVEEAGVPSVGLIDEGFELDWQTNAVERGLPLRYHKNAVRSEIRDPEQIAERMTPEVLDGIEDELTRPLIEKEQGIKAENR